MLRKMLAKIARCSPVYQELLQIRDAVNDIHADISDIHTDISDIHTNIGAIRGIEAIRCYDLELEHHPRYREPRRLHC